MFSYCERKLEKVLAEGLQGAFVYFVLLVDFCFLIVVGSIEGVVSCFRDHPDFLDCESLVVLSFG